GHGLAVRQHTSVHRPEPTLGQEVCSREAAGGVLQLRVAEPPRRLPEHRRLVLAHRAQQRRPQRRGPGEGHDVSHVASEVQVGPAPDGADLRQQVQLGDLLHQRVGCRGSSAGWCWPGGCTGSLQDVGHPWLERRRGCC
uniref:Uncharacterized protein n=1 Tax=Triticum urartu TaxID=4572 RepID=A0A8R7UFM8_TRIUA